jgi:hypothetical protein
MVRYSECPFKEIQGCFMSAMKGFMKGFVWFSSYDGNGGNGSNHWQIDRFNFNIITIQNMSDLFVSLHDFSNFGSRLHRLPCQDGLKAAKEALQIFRQLGLKKFQVWSPAMDSRSCVQRS